MKPEKSGSRSRLGGLLSAASRATAPTTADFDSLYRRVARDELGSRRSWKGAPAFERSARRPLVLALAAACALAVTASLAVAGFLARDRSLAIAQAAPAIDVLADRPLELDVGSFVDDVFDATGY